MPYDIAKGSRALVLDHRMVTTAAGFSHANDYLVDVVETVGANDKAAYRVFKVSPSERWTRGITPLDVRMNSSNPLKDVTETKFRKVSFFFNEVDAPVEIYVDNIGDTKSKISTMPMWREGAEGEPIQPSRQKIIPGCGDLHAAPGVTFFPVFVLEKMAAKGYIASNWSWRG